jgi:hypothetical protein
MSLAPLVPKEEFPATAIEYLKGKDIALPPQVPIKPACVRSI